MNDSQTSGNRTMTLRIGDVTAEVKMTDLVLRDHPPHEEDRLELRSEVDGQEVSLSLSFDDAAQLFAGVTASLSAFAWKSVSRHRRCEELGEFLSEVSDLTLSATEVRSEILSEMSTVQGGLLLSALEEGDLPIPAMMGTGDGLFVAYDPVSGERVDLSREEEAVAYIGELSEFMVTTLSGPQDLSLHVVSHSESASFLKEAVRHSAPQPTSGESVTFADFTASTPAEA